MGSDLIRGSLVIKTHNEEQQESNLYTTKLSLLRKSQGKIKYMVGFTGLFLKRSYHEKKIRKNEAI